MSHGIEVRIDRERCMGSGNCAFWAPEAFDLDDEGRSVVVDPESADEERLRLVTDGCPVGAISLWQAGSPIPVRPEEGA